MLIDSTELREALRIIDLVQSQQGIDSSQFIRLSVADSTVSLAISGTSIAEASVTIAKADGAEPYSVHVDRRMVNAFVAGAVAHGQKAVDITHRDDGTVLMKAGRQRINLADAQVTSAYEQWVEDTDQTVITPTADWSKYLAALCEYVPESVTSVEHLSAIFSIENYGLLATDTFCVAGYLDKQMQQTVPVPAGIAKLSQGLPITADSKGAGILYPSGYVYQTVVADCLTKFPLSMAQKLIRGAITTQAHALIESQALFDSLSYMKSFVFGADPTVTVTIQAEAGAKDAMISLDIAQGNVRRKMPCTVHTAINRKWRLAKILPWLEVTDPKSTIMYAPSNGNDTYREACNSNGARQMWVLLIAGF